MAKQLFISGTFHCLYYQIYIQKGQLCTSVLLCIRDELVGLCSFRGRSVDRFISTILCAYMKSIL